MPREGVIVEVGCDHGYISANLDAIGTERHPHRLPRRGTFRRVVADGLAPFRRVDVAVVTGIGAFEIARILGSGPRPGVAVLHAPDRPGWLRSWCAGHGWRINAERLAPERGRYAEILRVVPGQEAHEGRILEFGPLLLEDPLLEAHVGVCICDWRNVLAHVGPHDPAKTAHALDWIAFLEGLRPR